MAPSDTPLNKAHQHASNAEDYIAQGLLIPAAEEHYKSAEAFLQCVEQASHEGTKRTLRMLYNEHNKSGKELQKKIARLRDEGKDPSLPQISPAPPPERVYPHPTFGAPSMSLPYGNSRARMSDSNHTIDESYMVLGPQSSGSDTFNQFWKTLEGMLDNISQPVAFATAPLARLEATGLSQESYPTPDSPSGKSSIRHEGSSGSDDTDFRVGLVPKYSGRTLGLGQPGRERSDYRSGSFRRGPTSNPVLEAMEATIIPGATREESSELEEVLADEDSASGESFFMIPSATGPSLTTKLHEENGLLKREIASLQQRLETAERMRIEQEQQIRDRVLQARREAQRVMNSTVLQPRPPQTSIDLSALNLNVPPLSAFPTPITGSRDREAQLIRRVKDLEEEVRSVRIENEKQKAMIVKFRERWEKLKESAKRKRSAKASTGPENNVREQRIDEEPEAEAEADDGDAPKPLQAG